MNKKAASILMIIFEVVIVIVVVFMSMSIAKAFGQSDTLLKINTANNLQMMVNTLIGTPGDAVVEYPYNVSKFILLMDNNGVAVFKEKEPAVKKVLRSFILPQGYKASGAAKNKAQVCLEKTNKNLFLRECKKEETTEITVPSKLGQPDSQGIYTYQAPQATPLYYKYEKGKWQWSPDQDNWMPTSTVIVKAGSWKGQKPVQENKEIIQYLEQNNPQPK